jgi:hypothetical protein
MENWNVGKNIRKQNGFFSILKSHYSTTPAFHHSKLKILAIPTEMLF